MKTIVLCLLVAFLASPAPGSPAGTEKESLALVPGHSAVDAGRLRPIRKTWRGLRQKADGTFEATGLWTTELRREAEDGDELLVLTTYSAGNDFPLRRWQVRVDGRTLEPFDYEYRELKDGEAHAATHVRRTYADGVQRVTETVAGRVARERSTPIGEPAFDANLYSDLILAFPLREGLRARFPALHAEEDSVRWREYEVAGRVKIRVGLEGREAQAWIVREGPYRHWVTEEPPYVVRMEAPGPNGTVVASEVLEWSEP